ncbi:uncharacterized protein BDV17DRAFT_263951 [Aspergillus undulatus]|uniref:uncharacterized protein n=1 Tax=Aspergillus undulatus TaxID=1810928 RepID=UPI003CCCDA96
MPSLLFQNTPHASPNCLCARVYRSLHRPQPRTHIRTILTVSNYEYILTFRFN